MLFPLTIIAITIALGIAAGVVLIRTQRRQSYRRWSRPVRWSYYALVGVLVAFGGVGLMYHYTETWGWTGALAIVMVPFARGFLLEWERYVSLSRTRRP